MQFLTADYIYTLASEPIPNGVVVLGDQKIEAVLAPHDEDYASALSNSKRLDGIIAPPFINAHCHLELSYLKDKIAKGGGLGNFISQIVKLRNEHHENLLEAAANCDKEMFDEGIVYVGDICNTASTFDIKKNSLCNYFNFIETYDVQGLIPDTFDRAIKIKEQFHGMSVSIVPHAPYTVSESLMQKIFSQNSLFTIHQNESASENEMFKDGSGELLSALKKTGKAYDQWKPKKVSSLEYSLNNLKKDQRLMLVHNTYSAASEMKWANKSFSELYWCTCPNANLFIEERLPDYSKWIEAGNKCLIGTDSLASNDSLSMMEEIKTIQKNQKEISLETLLTWVCKNGAEFFNLDAYGTIEKGKRAAVVHISNVEENGSLVTSQSKSKMITSRL